MMLDIIQIILSIVILLLILLSRRATLMLGKSRRVIIDSCTLMDGRILGIVESGFSPGELIIPQFVINEIHILADGKDAYTRERARFGLDIVQKLQGSSHCVVKVEMKNPNQQLVDEKLVSLAKSSKAALLTNDYSLNQVAGIDNVQVLNINDLAQRIRAIAIPGEHVALRITQKGNGPRQGVGYLDDGTMVVAENAAKAMNKTVNIEITKVHQTIAGKMLFGKVVKG